MDGVVSRFRTVHVRAAVSQAEGPCSFVPFARCSDSRLSDFWAAFVWVRYAFAVLSQPTPDGKLLGDAQAEAVISILERWPTAQLFPVIDLTRLLAGHALHIFHSAAQKERLFAALFKATEWGASWNPPIPKARETNVLLVLRTAANVLQEGTSLAAEPWLLKVCDLCFDLSYEADRF